MPGRGMVPQNLPGPGRHLQIMDHTVHRIDTNIKANGEEETQVVAMQGMALFKLRITSLSSHRDKQRFRIRVSPVDTSLLLREPHLTAVTTPMKCVTKLSHRGSGGNKEGEGEEAGGENGRGDEMDPLGGMKRKRDDLEPMLEAQGQKLQELHQINVQILEQLKNI